MRKSHKQKAASRRLARQRRGRQKFYDALVAKHKAYMNHYAGSSTSFAKAFPPLRTGDHGILGLLDDLFGPSPLEDLFRADMMDMHIFSGPDCTLAASARGIDFLTKRLGKEYIKPTSPILRPPPQRNGPRAPS